MNEKVEILIIDFSLNGPGHFDWIRNKVLQSGIGDDRKVFEMTLVLYREIIRAVFDNLTQDFSEFIVKNLFYKPVNMEMFGNPTFSMDMNVNTVQQFFVLNRSPSEIEEFNVFYRELAVSIYFAVRDIGLFQYYNSIILDNANMDHLVLMVSNSTFVDTGV